jgi:cell division protein FtsW
MKGLIEPMTEHKGIGKPKLFPFYPLPHERPARILKTVVGIDLRLLLLILLLAVAGSVMIFSASYAYAETRYHNGLYFIERQTVWFFLGIGIMLLASLPNPSFYRKYAPIFYLATVVLLAAVLVIGSVGNGAQRWIAIGPITVQPSEIAKTTLVLMLAGYYSTYGELAFSFRKKKHSFLYGTALPCAMIGLLCLLVMLQKHLSGLIIIGCIGITVMFLSGIRLRYLASFGTIAGVGVTAFALFTDYTKRRITIWLNPELYPLDGGWQTLQGLMAIGSGGFFGKGFGKSVLKYSYVSEPANDMIFTILCEELGFFGAFGVILLFALFIRRIVTVALRSLDPFARLVALGIAAKVGIQVLLNICVVTNTIPNTGISLPFFSYGGSSLLMLFFEMGILLSISRGARLPD